MPIPHITELSRLSYLSRSLLATAVFLFAGWANAAEPLTRSDLGDPLPPGCRRSHREPCCLRHHRQCTELLPRRQGSFATAGRDNVIRTLECRRRQEIRQFKGHTNFVNSHHLSLPMASNCSRAVPTNSVRQWDVADGKEVRLFLASALEVSSPAWWCIRPDPRLVARGQERRRS